MTEGNSKEFEMAVGTSSVLESGMIEGENFYAPIETAGDSDMATQTNWTGTKNDTGQLCRSCANSSDYLIPIYEGEGLEHQLEYKIQKHMPIQVSSSDTLPLQLCYQCASTLIAWDSMISSCLEADKKLRAMQEAADETKACEVYEDSQIGGEADIVDSDDEPLITSKAKILSEKNNTIMLKKKLLTKTKNKTEFSENERTVVNSKGEEGKERSDLLSILAGIKQENYEFEDEKQVLDSADLHDLFDSSKEKLFRCNVCLKTYANVTWYEAHLKVHNNSNDESQMVCHICGAAFASLQDLKSHVATHSRNSSIYPCKLCGHVFSTFAARKRHKLTHLHSTDWTCELCKRKFTQHSFYIDHMLMHKLKKEMKIFICSCCGTNFENEESLLDHEKMHAEEENEAMLKEDEEDITIVDNIKMEPSDNSQIIVMPVEEVNCNGVVGEEGEEGEEEEMNGVIEGDSNVNVLKDGYAIIEVAQDEDGEFICGECGKECSDIESVNIHMKEHTQADIYECVDCKQVFKFKQSLLQHVRTVHETNRPYSCDVCWATFSSKNSLRNHRVIHLSLRYPCEECGNEFKGRSGLYLHKQRVHRGKKDFECDYCRKTFALKCQRDTHRRIHTGEKPFKCETCGAGFRAQSGLYAHRKTHTDERPYKCEICGKRLRLPYNLRLHMRTHTGEKPYACDICGRAFSQPGDCKKHKKTHRKKEEKNSAAENMAVSIKNEDKSDFVDITYLTYDS